ncbi:MAG: transglycosylase SLT domain-containing protein [Candidatus Pacearchaeota archaeon]
MYTFKCNRDVTENIMTNIRQYKNAKKNKKNKVLFFFVLLPVVITSLFYYALYQGYSYIEKRDLEKYQTGWEVGYMVGLEEGANNAYDEFYEKLSPNPNVSYLFKKYFPNQEEARIMRAISLAESKGKQTAVNKANRNGSIDSGFFQVNTIHRKKGETKEQFIARMHDLEENFKLARKVLDKQGLQAWATYNNKAYLTYLK